MSESDLVNLREDIKKLPTLPGVYIMKGRDGEVLYVGKAIDLRARVRSYFTGADEREQIEYLLQRVVTIDTIVTETEHQALVLERDLIGIHKPRFNIKLKDDRAYLVVRIDDQAEWPRLELVRRPNPDGAMYFGPFAHGGRVREAFEVVKKVVPLRSCSDAVLHNRQRPCLEFDMKRCVAPCCFPVPAEEYRGYVRQAVSILQGKNHELLKELKEKMEDASQNLRFEEAALYRDRVDALEALTSEKHFVTHGGENRDVMGLYRELDNVQISVLSVRDGRIVATRGYSLKSVKIPTEDVVESAVLQLYEGDVQIPDEILLPCALTNEVSVINALSARRGGKVEVHAPQRGIKHRLVNLAHLNARQQFVTRFAAEERHEEVLRALKERFFLSQIPRRIECVDISNFQGSDIVAGIVSFFDCVPDKEAYRKYTIGGKGKPDDFASIYEVVSRRLARGLEEESLPDLLVIDGGAGQLAMALRARDELGISLDIISIAKLRLIEDEAKTPRYKPERIFVEGQSESIPLDSADPVTHFLQRLRDETHRFAITFHRAKRGKRILTSVLDDILGVGPERRARLLKFYGSVDRIREAAVEDVARVGRMPASLAQKILKAISSA